MVNKTRTLHQILVVFGFSVMVFQGMVKGQAFCESEDGRLGFCVLTTDPESVAACDPHLYDIEEDVYRDCEYLEV